MTATHPDPEADRRRHTGPTALDRLSTPRVVLASGALLAVFAATLFASSAPFSIPTVEDACAAAPLDVRTTSSAEDVHTFLAGCGAAGREAYRNLQIADLLYPLVVGLFLTAALGLALRRLAPHRPGLARLAWLGVAVTAFDLLENAVAWRALASFPERAWTDGLLGLASAAKTATSWLAWLLLLGCAAILVGRAATRRLARPDHAAATSQ